MDNMSNNANLPEDVQNVVVYSDELAASDNAEPTLEEKVDDLLGDIAEIKELLEKNGIETQEETEAVTEQKWSDDEYAFASQKHDTLSAEALSNAGSYGLPFSLFGFSIVFSVLAVIMLIVIAFGKIFGSAEIKQKPQQKPKTVEKKQEKHKQNSMVESAPAPVAVAAPVSDETGIVAAIIAAITSFRGANGENGAFRVVSFKKRK